MCDRLEHGLVLGGVGRPFGSEQGWRVGVARESTDEMWQLWPCCDRVGADITILREREVDYDSDMPRKITEVLVRKVPDNQQVNVHPSVTSHALAPQEGPRPGNLGACPGYYLVPKECQCP